MAPGINYTDSDDLGPDLPRDEFDANSVDKLWAPVDYNARNQCAERVRRVEISRKVALDLYEIELQDWQAGIPWDLRNGQDVTCVVATGKGKTMVAVVYAALFPKCYILFISPLVALMQEQVEKFKSQGLSAICLTKAVIDETPDIWGSVAAGKFQIVVCAPEVVSSRNGSFWRRIVSKDSVFKKGCGLLVIDEAHLIWGWYVSE